MKVDGLKILEEIIACDIGNFEVLDQFPYPLILVDRSRIVHNANQLAKELGVEVGKYCWETLGQCASIPIEDKGIWELTGEPPPGWTQCTFCEADQVFLTGKAQKKQVTVGHATWEMYWVPKDEETCLHFSILLES